MGCGASSPNNNASSVASAIADAEARLARRMGQAAPLQSTNLDDGNHAPPATAVENATSQSVMAKKPETDSPTSASSSTTRPTADPHAAIHGMLSGFSGIPVATIQGLSNQVLASDIFKQVQSAVLEPEGHTKVTYIYTIYMFYMWDIDGTISAGVNYLLTS